MRPFPGAVPVSLAVLISTISSFAPLHAQTERRWIVDNAVAKSGDGTPSSPFLTIDEAVQAAHEGDTIVVSASTKPYAGPVVLRGGQSLLGEGGAPTISGNETVVTVIDGASGDVTIANVSIRARGDGGGVAVRNARGTVALRDVAIETAAGTGISVTNAAKLVIGGVSTVASVDAAAVAIDGSLLDVSLRSVSARGTRLKSAIQLDRVTGRFLVEGGTIEKASTRAISATAASNVTVKGMRITGSASVNDVPATQCGGDLIAGSNEGCNAAIYLREVTGATIDGVTIDGSAQAGIVAHAVSELVIANTTVRNAGDELFEHGLLLEELRGECRISGTKVERSASRNLMLHNSTGTLSLLVEGSTFSDTPMPHGQHGMLVTTIGDAVIDLRVRDSAFLRTFSHGLEVTAQERSKVALRISNSTFERNASAIALAASDASTLEYAIVDNPSISASSSTAINIYLGNPSSALLSGTIARNTIGKSGVAASGAACDSCSGISLRASGDGVLIANVTGNVIQQTGGGAIQAAASQGGARLHVTATSNLLRESVSTNAPAIRVQSGAAADDRNQVCADLGGAASRANTIEGAWEPNGAIHLVHRFGGTQFQLVGLTGGKDEAAAAAAVAARNGGTVVRAVLRPDSMERGFEPAERCTMPALAP